MLELARQIPIDNNDFNDNGEENNADKGSN